MLQPHPSRQLLAQVNAPSTVSRRRLHGSITHDLAVDIVAGTLKPGDVLPNEDQISERLQVSRTAYREGVRTLVAKGLVETRPKTGTRVTDRSHWNMLDPDVLSWHFEVEPRVEFVTSLFELRRVVEPGAAALAAQRRTDEDLAAMADALERMGQVTTGTVDGLEADLAFHHAILVATRNEPLIALSSAIGSTMRWSVRLTLTNNPQAHRDSLPEHQAVQRAIAAGDSAKAQKTMSLLVDHALEDTLHAFQRLVSRRHKR